MKKENKSKKSNFWELWYLKDGLIGNYKGRSRYRLIIIGKNIICCQWLIHFLIPRTVYQTHSNCKSRLLNIKVITAEPQRFYEGSLYSEILRSINHPKLSVNGSCSLIFVVCLYIHVCPARYQRISRNEFMSGNILYYNALYTRKKPLFMAHVNVDVCKQCPPSLYD